MGRQEILELVEATHPRIESDVDGVDGGRGAGCIADMSTHPEPTTGVTSRQTTCEEGATEHLHSSRIYNRGSRISLAARRYLISGPRAECHHLSHADGSWKPLLPQILAITDPHHISSIRTCRLLVRLDKCNGGRLEGSNADFRSPKGPSRTSTVPSLNRLYTY
jgi:hypothetical protein